MTESFAEEEQIQLEEENSKETTYDCKKTTFSIGIIIFFMIMSFIIGNGVGYYFSQANLPNEDPKICAIDKEILCKPENSTNCSPVPLWSNCFDSSQCGEGNICDKSSFSWFCRKAKNSCLIALTGYEITQHEGYFFPQPATPDRPCTFIEDIPFPVHGVFRGQCMKLQNNLIMVEARKTDCESYQDN